MAYDSTHQVTVLFLAFANDTWLWDGTTWVNPVQTQTAPVIDMSAKPDGIGTTPRLTSLLAQR